MENRNEFQFVPCQCGKTLRLKISKDDYGKKVIVTCRNCNKEHEITIMTLDARGNTVNTDFKEMKPHIETLADKLNKGIEDLGREKDIAVLRKLFADKGFTLDLTIAISISKLKSKPVTETSEAKADAEFLGKMNIKYD